METLELLQELVAGFPGTVILVSHDRDFLDRTVTSVIAPEGDGRWLEYAGATPI
jgi:ATP-binding cassette subfamily F protein uup